MGSIAQFTPSETRLFKPLKVGQSTLEHRIVFPPLTRQRNDDDHVPLPLMEKYYADRASTPGTLIIAEATAIAHGEEGNYNNPGLVSDQQVEGWRKIIDGVHANNSIFFQQLWAMGRASQPAHLAERGFPYRSSSDVPMKGSDIAPRAMTEEEILETIESFAETAKRAVSAGADGVEIHSAHGYLLDQFLTVGVNKRTDKWGGSIENRARLTLAVVKAVVEAIGAEKVGIRFSPYASFQGSEKNDFIELYTYLIAELKKMDAKFAYLSLVEAVGDPAVIVLDAKGVHQEKSLEFMLEAWDNFSPVIVAGGYTPQSAAWAVEDKYSKWDVMVAFGRHFISNPDLVFKIQNGIPLAPYNRATFYNVKEWLGYNDYPFSQEFLAANPKAVHPMTKEESKAADI